MSASERDVQAAIFDWAMWNKNLVPELDMLHATPNGQYRPGQRPEPGIMAGYPDMSLDVPRGDYHGLRIELKVDGGRVSEAQEAWIDKLNEQGYRAVVCWGFDAAIQEIENYLSLEDAS